MYRIVEFYKGVFASYPVQTKDEEREMIAKWRHDEAKLRELLILHNLRAAISLGSVYYSRLLGSDEAVRLAVIGLVKASEKFDLDKGVKFVTFATVVMRGYIQSEAMRPSVLERYVSSSMDTPMPSAGENGGTTMGDYLVKSVSVGYTGMTLDSAAEIIRATDKDDMRLIFDVIKKIDVNQKWREIVMDYFNIVEWGFSGDGPKSLEFVGERWGMSKETVAKILRRVVPRVRQMLLDRYSHEEIVAINKYRNRSKALGESGYCGAQRRIVSTRARPAQRGYRLNSNGVYARILDEGMKESKGQKVKAPKLSVHYYGGGPGVFYSDRYMRMCKAKSIYDEHIRIETMELVDNSDSSVEAFVEESLRAEEDLKRDISEGAFHCYTIGAIQDDGDNDYEMED